MLPKNVNKKYVLFWQSMMQLMHGNHAMNMGKTGAKCLKLCQNCSIVQANFCGKTRKQINLQNAIVLLF